MVPNHKYVIRISSRAFRIQNSLLPFLSSCHILAGVTYHRVVTSLLKYRCVLLAHSGADAAHYSTCVVSFCFACKLRRQKIAWL